MALRPKMLKERMGEVRGLLVSVYSVLQLFAMSGIISSKIYIEATSLNDLKTMCVILKNNWE